MLCQGAGNIAFGQNRSAIHFSKKIAARPATGSTMREFTTQRSGSCRIQIVRHMMMTRFWPGHLPGIIGLPLRCHSSQRVMMIGLNHRGILVLWYMTSVSLYVPGQKTHTSPASEFCGRVTGKNRRCFSGASQFTCRLKWYLVSIDYPFIVFQFSI